MVEVSHAKRSAPIGARLVRSTGSHDSGIGRQWAPSGSRSTGVGDSAAPLTAATCGSCRRARFQSAVRVQ
jgi:hypothetical protein